MTEPFWGKVQKTNTCWLWIGYLRPDGYGGYGNNTAHRVAFTLSYGFIPTGMCVCHHCDVKRCVKPNHLFLGTYKDNIQDALQKGRMATGDRNGMRLYPARRPTGMRNGRYTQPDRTARGMRNGRHTHPEKTARGEKVHTAKISWAEALTIRRSTDCTGMLSGRYGLAPSTIRRIKTGRYWKKEFEPSVS